MLMLQRENVGGFYLDVMQGTAMPCYWTPHGHSACGGEAITTGMHGLCEVIYDAVKAQDPEAITTGENSSENMIDVIDGVLGNTLEPENIAPIFAAVYQDYIPRYGTNISIDSSDAFFLEAASLFVEGAQVGRLALRPRPAILSFQKHEHKEMIEFLSRVVGYYKQEVAKKFLAYGQLMRPLEFAAPSPMPMLSYMTPYAGIRVQLPALMSGVFRSADSELGVFIVNVSKKETPFRVSLALARHGLSQGAVVDVEVIAPDGTTRSVLRKVKDIVLLKGSLPGRHITMFRLKPVRR